MTVSKTAKVQTEINKARDKLAKQQAHIKELENKLTSIENDAIVEIVRGQHIPLEKLFGMLQSINGN